jgi:hypothetical protein
MLQESFTDTLINIDVLLPKGEGDALAKVMQRSVDSNGKVIGEFNENSLLNTILYECKFEDGTTKVYTAHPTFFKNWTLMFFCHCFSITSLTTSVLVKPYQWKTNIL